MINSRHEIYINARIAGKNQIDAAKEAGYKAPRKAAVRLEILLADEIQKRMQPLAEKASVDAEFLIKEALEVLEHCKDDENYDAANALKSLEFLGKCIGITKSEIKGKLEANNGLVMNFDMEIKE